MIYRELFFVGFFADIALNKLSRIPEAPQAIKALLPYFEAHCPVTAAIYAGITTAVVGAIGIVFTPLLGFGLTGIPGEIWTSFLAGYVADILIEKLQIFGPSLQPFFDAAGAGLWGGLAIAFAVAVVRIGHKYKLLPRLDN